MGVIFRYDPYFFVLIVVYVQIYTYTCISTTKYMNTTFYNDMDIWEGFTDKVVEENPERKGTGRLLRSPSEVLRDLQELYTQQGEDCLKSIKK